MKDTDGMPEVSVGHVTLQTPYMKESIRFMNAIGMKEVFNGEEVSILELRGGTHLLLFPCEQVSRTDASFDLMVDDVHALHQKLSGLGYTVSPLVDRPDIGHVSFEVTEPSGTRITCFSDHSTCR